MVWSLEGTKYRPAAVNGLFDDVTTSGLKALVSDKSESDVEVNVGN